MVSLVFDKVCPRRSSYLLLYDGVGLFGGRLLLLECARCFRHYGYLCSSWNKFEQRFFFISRHKTPFGRKFISKPLLLPTSLHTHSLAILMVPYSPSFPCVSSVSQWPTVNHYKSQTFRLGRPLSQADEGSSDKHILTLSNLTLIDSHFTLMNTNKIL